jgi:hypothetical protein
MDFYALQSIVGSQKQYFKMKVETDSFRVAAKRTEPYIKPTFSKILYEAERPTVILISAVGATGKSTLGQVLSNETGLPLLDLGKHKPVGDNSLRGLLTSAFPVESLTAIFEGLSKGTYGVIIDGVDEGRVKTKEKAFHAFLDDIIRLSENATNTTFILLGRTQTLEESWTYISDRDIETGLLSIDPFSLDSAKQYIDEFTRGPGSPHADQYFEVRDDILGTLSSAFKATTSPEDKFASFIGYPPVLDAVVTLLTKESNYHKIKSHLESETSGDIEIDLLYRIASCISERERQQKLSPNVLEPLVANLPPLERASILSSVFGLETQCMRLVSQILGKTLRLHEIHEPVINEQYEDQLSKQLTEHPFIAERAFRNVVFEGLALAVLIASENAEAVQLGLKYLDSHKYNYHFVYFLSRIAGHGSVPITCLHALIGSALEFVSTDSFVEIRVEGIDPPAKIADGGAAVSIEIEILVGPEGKKSREFQFRSEVLEGVPVNLRDRVSSTFVSLPCEVQITSVQEIEFTAPVAIAATKITLNSPSAVLRGSRKQQDPDLKFVLLEAGNLESNVVQIQPNDVPLIVAVSDRTGLAYPIVQYAQEAQIFPNDSQLREKHLRLRRILVQFRSHSRGTMARFKRKIENERVAGNEIGQAVLSKLLSDGVLWMKDSHYFLNPHQVDKHLGITWLDLQKGNTTDRLTQYLRSIKV